MQKQTKALACILAAGKGTRMQSNTAKVLHLLHNKTLIEYPIDALQHTNISPIVLVVGHQKEAVIAKTKHIKDLYYTTQEKQLGTGHALLQAKEKLLFLSKKTGLKQVVVLPGDCPLISSKSLKNLVKQHLSHQAAASLLTANLNNPASYGRILRDKKGNLTGIKEAKDCNEDELIIKEINSGIYCFDIPLLFDAIKSISTNNAQGEYYLTDVIAMFYKQQKPLCGIHLENSNEILGINSKEDLRLVERCLSPKI